ncbi:MAG TPA: patatin family protein [Dehalococcoidia bacterium]|nr:patatin family protein [Dehalococcoidia bacterium]
MPRKKIGLALGSGAARGLAHIGVLAVLEKEGIPIDLIAGTSAGAAVGALYARSQDSGRIKELALGFGLKKLAPLVDPSFPKTGFIKGQKIKDLLASFIGGDIRFKDLKIPFACVATDVETGEEVVIDRGSVPEAIRASISVPLVFTVVKRGGRYLVDGGLVNPVPVSLAKRMGADFVIAVNVIPDVVERAHRIKEGSKGHKEPNLVHIIMQSLYIGTYALVRSSLEGADVVIEPKLGHIGAGDFHHAQECILQGELAAESAIPEIRRKLQA